MIDIPLGKALVPVEYDPKDYDKRHEVCAMSRFKNDCPFCCVSQGRKDNKYVIFELVDYPVEDENV